MNNKWIPAKVVNGICLVNPELEGFRGHILITSYNPMTKAPHSRVYQVQIEYGRIISRLHKIGVITAFMFQPEPYRGK